jgi:hypothetical protein
LFFYRLQTPTAAASKKLVTHQNNYVRRWQKCTSLLQLWYASNIHPLLQFQLEAQNKTIFFCVRSQSEKKLRLLLLLLLLLLRLLRPSILYNRWISSPNKTQKDEKRIGAFRNRKKKKKPTNRYHISVREDATSKSLIREERKNALQKRCKRGCTAEKVAIAKHRYCAATVNHQYPPAHHEGWMDGKWSGNSFLLVSSTLANHGDYLSCLLFTTYLLTTHKQVVSR